MLNLENKQRDEIIRALQAQTVSAPVGEVLMQIARLLANLKEVEVKKDDDSKEPKV